MSVPHPLCRYRTKLTGSEKPYLEAMRAPARIPGIPHPRDTAPQRYRTSAIPHPSDAVPQRCRTPGVPYQGRDTRAHTRSRVCMGYQGAYKQLCPAPGVRLHVYGTRKQADDHCSVSGGRITRVSPPYQGRDAVRTHHSGIAGPMFRFAFHDAGPMYCFTFLVHQNQQRTDDSG